MIDGFVRSIVCACILTLVSSPTSSFGDPAVTACLEKNKDAPATEVKLQALFTLCDVAKDSCPAKYADDLDYHGCQMGRACFHSFASLLDWCKTLNSKDDATDAGRALH
jgi:hypothetical protein